MINGVQCFVNLMLGGGLASDEISDVLIATNEFL